MVNNSSCLQIDNSNGSAQNLSCNPPSTNARVRRATDDELSAEIERMQKVARLATGISIQLDLMSGTLNPNELITELLHLGSVTPDQIIAMNVTDIQNAISELKTLPERLSRDLDQVKFETKLEELMEIWSLVKHGGDGTKWIGKDAFLAEMNSVRENKIGLEPALNADDFIQVWEAEYMKLVDPNLDISRAKDYVRDLKWSTEGINSSISQLVNAAKNGAKLPNMFRAEEGVDSLSSLLAAVTAITSKFNDISISLLFDFKVYHWMMQNVKKISEVFSTQQITSIRTVKNVVKNRLSALNFGPSKFPGFANGLTDLNSLLDNLDDPWIKQFVKSDAMSASLTSVKQLAALLRAADSLLGSPRDVRLIEDINEILMLPENSSAFEHAINIINNCKYIFNREVKPDTSKVVEFVKLVKVVDEKIKEANEAMKIQSETLDTRETKRLLKGLIEMCTTSDNSTVMQGIVDELKSSYQLEDLHKKFEKIDRNGYSYLKYHAGEIIKNATVVDDLITNLTTSSPFLKCLFDVSDDNAKVLKNGVAISRRLSDVTRGPSIVDNGEMVMKNVIKSGSSLRNLITAIENFKNFSSAESDALKSLPDHQKHAKIIGSAARKMHAMAMALQKKNDVNLIIQNIDFVEKRLHAVKNPNHVRNLRAVVRLGTSLNIVFPQLEAWRDGVNVTRSTVLASYSDLFSSTAWMSGMTADFESMAKSVGVLAEKVSDPKDKPLLVLMQGSLESLGTIDWNFAAYSSNQRTDAHDSLAALDLFFANFNPIVSTTVAPTPNITVASRQLVLQPSTTENTSTFPVYGIILGVLLGVDLLVAAIGLIFWLVVRKKKEPELEEVTARDENSVPLDVLPPRSTGITSGTV